ncbi:hypothetical protein TNCV_3760761 [Trichonephila clavipes]|nr:hypothetical protein TNCV_3760761 [Trichonephila clavipes]
MRYLSCLIDTVFNRYRTKVFSDEEILFSAMIRKNQVMKSITAKADEDETKECKQTILGQGRKNWVEPVEEVPDFRLRHSVLLKRCRRGYE